MGKVGIYVAMKRSNDYSFPWQVIDSTRRTAWFSGSVSRHRTKEAAEKQAKRLNKLQEREATK